MSFVGRCRAKFNSGEVIGMLGTWNVSIDVPEFRAYGQGGDPNADGSVVPGDGYIGGSIGTAMNVSGSCEFTIDVAGTEAAKVMRLLGQFFTWTFPLGDPMQGAGDIKAIDAHIKGISFDVDNPNGKVTLRGNMTAGKVTGPGITQ